MTEFVTVKVSYCYPVIQPSATYSKEYTVPSTEPFPNNHAFKQWQRDHSLPHKLIAYKGAEILGEAQYSHAPTIQLPLGFCETRYPGYFWNSNELKLYSLKSGMLKPIPRKSWKQFDGYVVSHKGIRRYLSHRYLLRLVPVRAVIPMQPIPKRIGSRWQ
jgi:hypothetical protein